MDQWLVRTANNIIAGPYSREQVVKLIHEGKLGLQDEVCQANHYWIFLHEHLEVLKQLGINMPRAARGDDEEVTETQTDQVNGSNPTIELELESLPETPDDYEGGTALISRGTFNDAKSTDRLSASGAAPAMAQAQPQAHLQAHATATPAVRATGPGPALVTTAPPVATARPAPAPRPSVVGQSMVTPAREQSIERSSVWKTFAWMMLLVVCAIVYAVLRLLHVADMA